MSTSHKAIRPEQEPQFDESQPVQVLFIGGMGRSGTTILELSLATDPRVVSLGEVIHLWERCLIDDERCGCGLAFSECRFWEMVGERAFGGWSAVDAQRVLRLKRKFDRIARTPQLALFAGGRRWRREVVEYASYYSRIYAAAAWLCGADAVIDSSKQASLAYILRLDPRLNLKVLHCVRDSRAVAYSWTRARQRPEARGGERSMMARHRPRVMALRWIRHNLVLEALRVLGVPMMRLRYEDWTSSPDGALTRIMDFLGLPDWRNDHVGADWVELPDAHTCSGNPMRFQTGRVQVRLDDEWRHRLAGRSKRLVTILTGPLLAAYGYWRD